MPGIALAMVGMSFGNFVEHQIENSSKDFPISFKIASLSALKFESLKI
jgi:hypothetical protein